MENMIPHLIHFVWTGLPGAPAPAMPEWAQYNIAEFERLNPEHKIMIHGQEVLLDKYRVLYNAATTFAHTSDLLRYSALQKYGGWYFDTDVFPFRPVQEIEDAYGLQGKKLFITEQHGQLSKHLTRNGAMLACGTDCIAWDAINEHIAALPVPPERIATGPRLLTNLEKQKPWLFDCGAWPWFYPAAIGRAAKLYYLFRKVGTEKARRIAPTGGQYPYMMHLWCNEKPELSQKDARLLTHYEPDKPSIGCALVAPNTYQWEKSAVCGPLFRAIASGLTRCGYTVDVASCDQPLEKTTELGIYDCAFLWNGRAERYKRAGEELKRHRIPTIILELGFFDRNVYWQADHAGILHWASWAQDLKRAAPAGGAERLGRVWPHELASFGERKGYVLVFGQVRGDTQMADSELSVSTTLDRMVFRSVEGRTPAYFRKHPNARVVRKEYCPRINGDLTQAIQGARFAVTINSNAGNECLALGCPVMCFGPALYEMAGVVKRTTMATFKRDFDEMMEGWRPATDDVRNYLEWLACRQWNKDELRAGSVIADLIRRATGE